MIPGTPIQTVVKVWGHETWIVNNDKYCGKILVFLNGKQGSLHYHKVKHETFYLVCGLCEVQVGDDIYRLEPGGVIEIPPGVHHRIKALQYSEVYEFSTTHNDDDTYRLEDSL